MKDFILRLTSRKFLLTVGGCLILIANQQWNELIALIAIYSGVEGGADIVGRLKQPAVEAEKIKQATVAMENGLVPQGFESRIAPGAAPEAAAGAPMPGNMFTPGADV